MLETITKGFSLAKDLLRKQTTLSDDNISEALKEVRLSLLEADVEYSVVKYFIEKVRSRALGLMVQTSVTDKKGRTHKLTPSEHFIGICYEELESLMGPESDELTFKSKMATFMMVGLQGSGKTTSSAKLAKFLEEEKKKKPLLVAADIYRPGAAHQLQILGERLNVPVFHIENESAQEICRRGLQFAHQQKCDAVIFDTAGRLAIDEELMAELDDIKEIVKPEHIFLVVDAMIGQDAVTTASLFDKRLDVSGFILTKLDGDARGGAAISIKQVTKKPIRFLGMGEDLNSLEPFRAQGLASRILGMGDVVSLAKDFEKHIDEKEAEEDIKRLTRGNFSFDDFLKQMNLMKKLGSFQSIMERIPGMQNLLPSGAKIEDRDFIKFESMVFSMTKEERVLPELLVKQKSRRVRVANGCGRNISDLDQLVERFMGMRQMMQMFGKNPKALANLPMFKEMGRAGEIAKNYGSDPMAMMKLMGSDPTNGFDPLRSPVSSVKSKISVKEKKDKRKKEKLARKKSKKRK